MSIALLTLFPDPLSTPHLRTKRFLSAFIVGIFSCVSLYFALLPSFDNDLDILKVAPPLLSLVGFATSFGVGVLVSGN